MWYLNLLLFVQWVPTVKIVHLAYKLNIKALRRAI